MFSYGFLIDLQLSIIALWAVYFLVIHRRVSVKVSRTILLLILPIAFVVSTVKIPMFTQIAPISEPDFIENISQIEDEYIQYGDPVSQVTEPNVMPITNNISTVVNDEKLSGDEILFYTYLAGVLVMIVLTIISVLKTVKLIRKSTKDNVDGQDVVFTKENISACSFFGYIIVNESYRNSQWLRAVILHENYHSRCHHTFDLIYMILVRVLLWFNPVSWHMMKLIRQVHEYEVDRKVVESGESLSDYMALLIDSNFAKTTTFCNSLSYSLTKKRLIMITKHYSSFSYLRIITIAPVIALLICAFVFTAKTEALAVNKQQSNEIQIDSASIVVYDDRDSNLSSNQTKSEPEISVNDAIILLDNQTKSEPEISDTVKNIDEQRKQIKDNVQHKLKYKFEFILPSEGDLPEVMFNYDDTDFLRVFKEVTGKDLDRRLAVSIDPKYIESIVFINGNKLRHNTIDDKKKTILVSLKSNISYYDLSHAILMEGGSSYGSLKCRDNSVNSNIIIKTADGGIVKTRYPLSSKYKEFISRINSDYIKKITHINAFKAVSNYGIAGINGVTLIELKPFEGALCDVIPNFNDLESNQLINFRNRYNTYDVKPSQVKIARQDIKGNEEVLRIRHTDTETIVTMGYRIYFESNWIAPNSNQVLEDIKTGDRYNFRRVDGGIPKDKVLVFNGYRGKVVELDYVFPRLADDVKEVILYDSAPSNYQIPLNAAPETKHRIRIANYINKKPGKDIY